MTIAMMRRVLFNWLFMTMLSTCSAYAGAADEHAPARELWAGTYECSANEADARRWPAYEARIQLTLEGGTARIVKESARIRETLSGHVGEDGKVTLDGGGEYKGGGGPGWRYRFAGRFDGDHFEARGVMLTPGMGTKLRDCSITLTRGGVAPQAVARNSASKPKPKPKPKAQVKAKAKPKAVAAPRPAPSVEAPVAAAEEIPELPAAVQEALLPPFHAAVNRIDAPAESAGPAADAKGKGASADSPTAAPFWRNPIAWSAVILAVALIGFALVAYKRRTRRIFSNVRK